MKFLYAISLHGKSSAYLPSNLQINPTNTSYMSAIAAALRVHKLHLEIVLRVGRHHATAHHQTAAGPLTAVAKERRAKGEAQHCGHDEADVERHDYQHERVV